LLKINLLLSVSRKEDGMGRPVTQNIKGRRDKRKKRWESRNERKSKTYNKEQKAPTENARAARRTGFQLDCHKWFAT